MDTGGEVEPWEPARLGRPASLSLSRSACESIADTHLHNTVPGIPSTNTGNTLLTPTHVCSPNINQHCVRAHSRYQHRACMHSWFRHIHLNSNIPSTNNIPVLTYTSKTNTPNTGTQVPTPSSIPTALQCQHTLPIPTHVSYCQYTTHNTPE